MKHKKNNYAGRPQVGNYPNITLLTHMAPACSNLACTLAFPKIELNSIMSISCC